MRFKAHCVHSKLLAPGTDMRREIVVAGASHEVAALQSLVVSGLTSVCLRGPHGP